MIKVFVNDKEVEIASGSTVFQACLLGGVEIPRFCYHERLSIAGNCRMCLVEVEKSPKPVASCAMPVMAGMKIKTNTPLVKKAREGVLEFLLINHPLDCPICDQGGECDLQDLTMVYGSDRGRFHEYKRSVEDKNLGPLIKTIMTRCIHCTRCVRFAEEIAGVPDLGTVGRGRETEIATYVEKIFDSEVSGNVIDLCPVGALTSKPYAFTSRPWELKSTETIDISDSIGSNIRVDVRGSSIMRVLPRLNESINEEWISDKTRFSYDGLQRQRLHTPLLKVDNVFKVITWSEALNEFVNQIQRYEPQNVSCIMGSQVDIETSYIIKEFMSSIGSSGLYFEKYFNNDTNKFLSNIVSDRINSDYFLKYSLPDLEEIDSCLLVGVNPRFESTLLNLRLRKRSLKGNFKIASIGPETNTTYPVENLGNSQNTLLQIVEGRHSFCKFLAKSSKSVIFVGSSVFRRNDAKGILSMLNKLQNIGIQYSIIHSYSGFAGYQELGILNERCQPELCLEDQKSSSKFVISLEADDINVIGNNSKSKDYFVYIGHHGDKFAANADLILPSAAFTEKENAHYMNIEGRTQATKLVLHPPAEGREAWEIIRAISELLNSAIKLDSKDKVQEEIKNFVSPLIYSATAKEKPVCVSVPHLYSFKSIVQDNSFNHEINVENYYSTDPVCRSSAVMGKCIKSKHTNKK